MELMYQHRSLRGVAGQQFGATIPAPDARQSRRAWIGNLAGSQPTTAAHPSEQHLLERCAARRLRRRAGIVFTSLSEYRNLIASPASTKRAAFLDAQFLQTATIESAVPGVSGSAEVGRPGQLEFVASTISTTTRSITLLDATASPNSPTHLPFRRSCAALGPFQCTPAETPFSPTWDPVKYPILITEAVGAIRISAAQQKNDYAAYASAEYRSSTPDSVGGRPATRKENIGRRSSAPTMWDGTWAALNQGISNS